MNMPAQPTPSKSLSQLLRAAPGVLGAPEVRGMLQVMQKQLGLRGGLRVLGRIINNFGTVNLLSDLSKNRMGRVSAHGFIAIWEAFADREAIVDGDKRETYGQMRDRVLRLANYLQDLGVEPKDRVAVMLYNSREFLESLYACSLIGAPMPALNWHAAAPEVAQLINLRKPKVLIVDAEFLPRIEEIKGEIPSVQKIIVADGVAPEGYVEYEQALASSQTSIPAKLSFLIAINPYTGGTTGTPKSSNLYDMSFLISDIAEPPRASMDEYLQYAVKGMSFIYWYGSHQIEDPKDHNIHVAIPTPMYHAGTLVGMAPSLALGATSVPVRKFSPEGFLRLIEKERIAWTFVAPTILQRILALPDEVKRKYNLSAMHTIVVAAAPCPPEVKRGINELFMAQGAKGPVVHEYYGTSEAGVITCLIPQDYLDKPERIASVGKARCGDLKIYVEAEGRWANPGETGRVMVRTASTLSLRYPGSEEKLKDTFKTIDGVEWYDDGLIGYLDADGFLYLTSRVKEMIISGGVNVYPNEIETVLLRHPKVFDVAVVRSPDPDLGEVAAACVQLKEGETLSEAGLLEFAKQEGLYGYKMPKQIIFYPELPRHIDGKLRKADLEEQFWHGISRRG